jgi:prepilin-type N-terminal cleavage/methylation domain-containing protein
MRTRHNAKARSAFTLIEILIVVVILGILAAIVIPQFAESADSANENSARSTLQTVRSQFELCRFNNAHADCTCAANNINDILNALVGSGLLQSMPTMPTGFVLNVDNTGPCARIVVDGQTW